MQPEGSGDFKLLQSDWLLFPVAFPVEITQLLGSFANWILNMPLNFTNCSGKKILMNVYQKMFS